MYSQEIEERSKVWTKRGCIEPLDPSPSLAICHGHRMSHGKNTNTHFEPVSLTPPTALYSTDDRTPPFLQTNLSRTSLQIRSNWIGQYLGHGSSLYIFFPINFVYKTIAKPGPHLVTRASICPVYQ
jgi:hypothetical protein